MSNQEKEKPNVSDHEKLFPSYITHWFLWMLFINTVSDEKHPEKPENYEFKIKLDHHSDTFLCNVPSSLFFGYRPTKLFSSMIP